MRLHGWEMKALVCGVCLGVMGCTANSPTSKSQVPRSVNGVQLNAYGELPPPAVQQGDRQLLFFDTISNGTFESMLGSLPARIPAAQANILLIHLDQDKIASTYSVQARDNGHGDGNFHNNNFRDGFNRFNSFNTFTFGYPFASYPYSSFLYYPYYGYYYPYTLTGSYYTPYTYGSTYPFYYQNPLTSMYSPYYWGGLGGSGLLPPGYTGMPGQPQTAATATAPVGQMPTTFGQPIPYGPIL